MNFANLSLPPTPSPDAITALLQLFDLVSNPEKHRALIAELTKARHEAQKAVAEFEDLKAKRAELDAERDVIRVMAKAHQDRLEDAMNALAADRAALTKEQDAHALAVKAHAAERQKFDELVAAHSARLAELDRLKKVIAA